MKKLLSLALSLVIAFSVFAVPLSVGAVERFEDVCNTIDKGVTADGWKYDVCEENFLLNSGHMETYATIYGYSGDAKEITIPTEITITNKSTSKKEVYPVRLIQIGKDCISDCVEEIKIPDNNTPADVVACDAHFDITLEGRTYDPTCWDYCGYFATPNLKSIEFGSFFPYVPRHCCDGAKKLKEVTFTNDFLKSKPEIGEAAFANTGLEELEIPDGISGIRLTRENDTCPRFEDANFEGSNLLRKITLGKDIKTLHLSRGVKEYKSLSEITMLSKDPNTVLDENRQFSEDTHFGSNLTVYCYSGTQAAYYAYQYYNFKSLGQCDGEPWTPEPTTTTTEPTTAPPSEPYTTPITENDEWFVGGWGFSSEEYPLKMTYDSEEKVLCANVKFTGPDTQPIYVYSGKNGAETDLSDDSDESIKIFGFNGSSKYNHIIHWQLFMEPFNVDFLEGNYTLNVLGMSNQPFDGKITFDGTKVRAFYIDAEGKETELYSYIPPQATATTTTAPPTTTTTLPTTVVPSTTLPETTDVTLRYKGNTYTNSNPKLAVGRSVDYDFSFYYPQSTCSVELESSNKKVAQVNSLSYDKQSQAGKIQIVALDEGTAKITINIKSLSGRLVGTKILNLTVTSMVKTVNLSGKRINKLNTINMYVGENTKVNATVSPTSAIQKVNWKSTNAKVATVDSRGKVTAVGKGTCYIQAWATDGSRKYKSCKVNTFVREIKSIKLSKSTLVFKNNKDASKTLKATVSPANASYAKDIKWSSNKPNVATVTSKGTVTPKKNGACWIYAKATDGSDITAKCLVIVGPQVKSIKISKTSVTLKPKQTMTLKVTYNPTDAVYKKVQWTSNNKKIATVNSKGKVTAKKKGSCYITAKTLDGSNKTVKCKVIVK